HIGRGPKFIMAPLRVAGQRAMGNAQRGEEQSSSISMRQGPSRSAAHPSDSSPPPLREEGVGGGAVSSPNATMALTAKAVGLKMQARLTRKRFGSAPARMAGGG